MDFRRAASEQQRKTERRIITTGYIARDVTHTLDRMMANRLNKTGYRIQESRGALKQEALKDNATFAEKKKYYGRFRNGSESITVKKDEVSSVLRDVGGKYRHMTFSGRRLTSFSLKNGIQRTPFSQKHDAEITFSPGGFDKAKASFRNTDELGRFRSSMIADVARPDINTGLKDRMMQKVYTMKGGEAMFANGRIIGGKKTSWDAANARAKAMGKESTYGPVFDRDRKGFTAMKTSVSGPANANADAAVKNMTSNIGFATAVNRNDGVLVHKSKTGMMGTRIKQKNVIAKDNGDGTVTLTVNRINAVLGTRAQRVGKMATGVAKAGGQTLLAYSKGRQMFRDVMEGRTYSLVTTPIKTKIRNKIRDALFEGKLGKKAMLKIGLLVIPLLLLLIVIFMAGAIVVVLVSQVFAFDHSMDSYKKYADYVVDVNTQLVNDVNAAKGGNPYAAVNVTNGTKLDFKGLFAITKAFYGEEDVEYDRVQDVLNWGKNNLYRIKTTKDSDGETTMVEIRVTTYQELKKKFTGGYENARTTKEKIKALANASEQYRKRIDAVEKAKRAADENEKKSDEEYRKEEEARKKAEEEAKKKDSGERITEDNPDDVKDTSDQEGD